MWYLNLVLFMCLDIVTLCLLLARSSANGEEAGKKLGEEAHKARFVEADLTKPDTITALKEKLVKEHGGIDILVNNAGMAFKVSITCSNCSCFVVFLKWL